MAVNRFKLNRIVESIGFSGEFPFNVEDVFHDLDRILHFFNIVEPLTDEEREELMEDLEILALQEEQSEVIRLLLENDLIELDEATQLALSHEDKLRVRWSL